MHDRGPAISDEDRYAAIADPEYHRHLMFSAVDAEIQAAIGRPLLYHETQSRLPWPQVEAINRIERAIADARAGAPAEIITLLSSRQTGKGEIEAMVEDRVLLAFERIPGSVYVRTAPTKSPQVGISKRRLEKHLIEDPLFGPMEFEEGYIVRHGKAEIHFLSASKTANVVGSTASIALSVDECHKIDASKFEEDIKPFTARTNAPTIMAGVAADQQDLLHAYRERNQGTDRDLCYPAPIWCDLSDAYAAHFEERLQTLGADHPILKTQYLLESIEAMGVYLNQAKRRALFHGEHPKLEGPRSGYRYVLICDIGGESEVDADSDDVMAMEPGRDYTIGWIVEIDPSVIPEPFPMTRVVDGYWAVGESHEKSKVELLEMCKHYGVGAGVIDARGVGEAMAKYIQGHIPGIIPYKASSESVSEDCYDLLARLNNGRVQFWRADPTVDPIRAEMEQQARHTRYQIHGHELMRIVKPTTQRNAHIDFVKALTYLGRAVATPHSGVFEFTRQQAEDAKHRKAVEEQKRRMTRAQ